MKAIGLGYDILLEKPVSPDSAECKKMAEAAKTKGVKILVCHVLRAETCPYNEVKIYEDKCNGDDAWWYGKHAAGIPNSTAEHIENIIKNTQYGKCVFKCDNDVVDHQTLNGLYEDDITLTFTMTAFNKGGRTTHVFGTKGELYAAENKIAVYDFETTEPKEIPIVVPNQDNFGNGGYYGIVCALYDYIMGTYTGNAAFDIGISVENHIAVFVAEKSRAECIIVDIDEYIASL